MNSSYQSLNERSALVNTVAYALIVISGICTVMFLLQNILVNTLFSAEIIANLEHKVKAAQNIPPFVEFVFLHFRLIFAATLLLSLIVLASSLALLKRKNWGRIMVIILLTIAIVCNLTTLLHLYKQPPAVPAHTPLELQPFFHVTHILFIFMVIALSILLAWIIKLLTTQKVRREFNIAS